MILETLATIYMGLFSLMIAVGYIGAELFPPPTGEGHDGGVDWAKKTPIAYLPSLVYNQGSILPFYALTVAAYVQPYANLYIITKNNQARDY